MNYERSQYNFITTVFLLCLSIMISVMAIDRIIKINRNISEKEAERQAYIDLAYDRVEDGWSATVNGEPVTKLSKDAISGYDIFFNEDEKQVILVKDASSNTVISTVVVGG